MTADRRNWVEVNCPECDWGVRVSPEYTNITLASHFDRVHPEDESPPIVLKNKPLARHPASSRFHEILESLGELHDRKQADYGLDNDPFANVRASQSWGMPAWVGAMVRATDKVRRLQTFARKGELANESALDAFDDLAVYAVIARVLYEEEAERRPDPDEVGFS